MKEENENKNTYINQLMTYIGPLAKKLRSEPSIGHYHSPEAKSLGTYLSKSLVIKLL